MIEIDICQHFESDVVIWVYYSQYISLENVEKANGITESCHKIGIYCITQCRGNNNPDGQIWYVTHCFFNFPAMALSQENVLKDYSVHRTGVGILKKIKL